MTPLRNDAISLTLSFFTGVKGRVRDVQGRIDVPDAYKRRILDEISSLLAGGHKPYAIEEIFSRPHPKKEEVYSVKELFDLFGETCHYGQVRQDPDNLLTPGRFYYHPFLQECPGPPLIRTNEEGEMEFVEQPFFLEMKESLTVHDLHEYLRQFFGWGPLSKKYEGAYRYLLKEERGYDAEDLLFMADCARADMDTNGANAPMSPLRLTDYEPEMQEAMESRKNICYEGGLHYVIPRDRSQNPVD